MVEQLTSLTLEELAERVTSLLTERGFLDIQQDHRISAVPDARTIRYYTTLGLLDRPITVGRQAHYGRRQLLQLLAIKVLQSRSMPLAEIQARLYGRSDTELEAILAALSNERRVKSRDIRPVYWREVVIEPGLKIMAEESWSSNLSTAALAERIQAALTALQTAPERAERGEFDGHSD